ncbi:NAD(P)/FAD-dependent oxidoreductase [Phreatobacter aquaticus]|uniref:NAD(P)/FAD-dependent oxidoreductase n=1 Tax=Phreatobacter aquaticus TaxID=2570229 RepID=A0A4D7QH82_9HYPH|nr:NAD(P)/FAD-dependent oxidoreductase [Phreatobacter aquaticus]QCK84747.1 NAD(P)/FAD-dependent oxidoreductase [Phreatobacter aquaticus]
MSRAPTPHRVDVVVLGAGAAGMMAAIEAGRRGRKVLIIDHADEPGEKIRISGGGRCNFTNLGCSPKAFISDNPRFCISALTRYTQHDFIKKVDQHRIPWHEKTLGQLFCDGSAMEIIAMLREEMAEANVDLALETSIDAVEKTESGFALTLSGRAVTCKSLVVATGGKSIPKMGATGIGYDLARQFGLAIVEPRAGLVPLTFSPDLLHTLSPLAGIAADPAAVSSGKTRFEEAVLFTHRGLSGPAILQISSYWREGEAIEVALAPGTDVLGHMRKARSTYGRQAAQTALAEILPKRLAQVIVEDERITGNLADLSDKVLTKLADRVNAWKVVPNGSEGYRTAEVTLGGVDTRDLDQKTMEARSVPGLHFIGEVVDVTGWLGGYNFQWAWSSGWAAGQAV